MAANAHRRRQRPFNPLGGPEAVLRTLGVEEDSAALGAAVRFLIRIEAMQPEPRPRPRGRLPAGAGRSANALARALAGAALDLARAVGRNPLLPGGSAGLARLLGAALRHRHVDADTRSLLMTMSRKGGGRMTLLAPNADAAQVAAGRAFLRALTEQQKPTASFIRNMKGQGRST